MNRTLIQIAATCSLLASAEELKDVEFARPAGVALTLDANIPTSSKPQGAVILVHGGGWEAGDKRTYIGPWFTTLDDAGVAWFTINYRLAPEWKQPAAVEDVEAAAQWVQANAKRFNLNPRKIVLMGESAGGHLAALAAVRGRVKVAGLVSFYGVHDLPLWFRQRGEVPKNIGLYLPDTNANTIRSASPVAFLNPAFPPMLLVHGTADKGVPFEQSQKFCESARTVNVKCELVLIEGAPHGVENWELEPRFHIWKPQVTQWLRHALR